MRCTDECTASWCICCSSSDCSNDPSNSRGTRPGFLAPSRPRQPSSTVRAKAAFSCEQTICCVGADGRCQHPDGSRTPGFHIDFNTLSMPVRPMHRLFSSFQVKRKRHAVQMAPFVLDAQGLPGKCERRARLVKVTTARHRGRAEPTACGAIAPRRWRPWQHCRCKVAWAE
jgi:hypothetical protein